MIKKLLTLLLLLWVVACSPTENGSSNPVSIPPELTALVEKITSDVRARSDKDMTLQTVQRVTWEDGSLGCPEPELLYTMALVDGYQVVFTDGERHFHYHTDGSLRYVYCENPDK